MAYFTFRAKIDDRETTGKGADCQLKVSETPPFWHTISEAGFPEPSDAGVYALTNRAKITDVVSPFASTHGFLLSSRLRKLLEICQLPQHQYYPALLRHKEQVLTGYWYLHLLWDGLAHVDYANSNCVVWDIFKKEVVAPASIISYSEYLAKREELNGLPSAYLSLAFTDLQFLPGMDLDLFPFWIHFWCSERLASLIQGSGVTGLELAYFPVIKTTIEHPASKWFSKSDNQDFS
jgi:hypothetical protein